MGVVSRNHPACRTRKLVPPRVMGNPEVIGSSAGLVPTNAPASRDPRPARASGFPPPCRLHITNLESVITSGWPTTWELNRCLYPAPLTPGKGGYSRVTSLSVKISPWHTSSRFSPLPFCTNQWAIRACTLTGLRPSRSILPSRSMPVVMPAALIAQRWKLRRDRMRPCKNKPLS